MNTPGYHQYWNYAERPGYAGTLILTRKEKEPLSDTYGIGVEELDREGRVIALEYKDFYIVNAYVPSLNPYSSPERPDYRLEWEAAFRSYLSRLQQVKPVVLCGDFNATRAYIDSYPDNGKNEPDKAVCGPESIMAEKLSQLMSTSPITAAHITIDVDGGSIEVKMNPLWRKLREGRETSPPVRQHSGRKQSPKPKTQPDR